MRPHRGWGKLCLWGRPWWPVWGPSSKRRKVGKPLLPGAALAGVGVSSYWELVFYDMRRVSCFPSSAGVMWKENLPSFRIRDLTFLGNSHSGQILAEK